MGNSIQTFEVRVLVKKKGSRHFSSHVGMHIEETMARMFHVDAKTHQQAMQKAEKHGRPLTVRKVDKDRMMGGNIENLLLQEPFGANNPYPNAVAMDEMIWKKKKKRAGRRDNHEKDKNDY